jgi:hypothetical protein
MLKSKFGYMEAQQRRNLKIKNEELKIKQEQFKLQKAQIFYTPLGQTKARQVYRQKKTGKLYFGDGTPYTALGFKNIGPDLSFVTKVDVVANPFTPNIDNIA